MLLNSNYIEYFLYIKQTKIYLTCLDYNNTPTAVVMLQFSILVLYLNPSNSCGYFYENFRKTQKNWWIVLQCRYIDVLPCNSCCITRYIFIFLFGVENLALNPNWVEHFLNIIFTENAKHNQGSSNTIFEILSSCAWWWISVFNKSSPTVPDFINISHYR